jgi:hypothetical protein
VIVLDTSVVSEGMRPEPHAAVAAWLQTVDPVDLAVTTVTLAEILYGIVLLPRGRRRADLELRFKSFVTRVIEDRVLVFDTPAAEHYAAIAARRRAAGRPASQADVMVAAVAAANGAGVATRNVADFADFGISVLDPWNG